MGAAAQRGERGKLFCKTTSGCKCCMSKLGDNMSDAAKYDELRKLRARDLSADECTKALSALRVAKEYVANYRKLTKDGSMDLVAKNGKTYFHMHKHPKKNDLFSAFDRLDAFKFKRVAGKPPDWKQNPGLFAFVWTADPTHTIHLGDAFFASSCSDDMKPDSRPGTILHEVSHFDDVLGTIDIMYGSKVTEEDRYMREHVVHQSDGTYIGDTLTQNAESLEYMFEKGFAHSGSWNSRYWDCCGEIAKNSLCQNECTIGGHAGKYHCGHVGDCSCYGAFYCDCVDSCNHSPHWTCCNAPEFHSYCAKWLDGRNVLASVQDIPAGMGAMVQFTYESCFEKGVCKKNVVLAEDGEKVFAFLCGDGVWDDYFFRFKDVALSYQGGAYRQLKQSRFTRSYSLGPRKEVTLRVFEAATGVLPKTNLELWYYDPETMDITNEELVICCQTPGETDSSWRFEMVKLKGKALQICKNEYNSFGSNGLHITYTRNTIGPGSAGAGICLKSGATFKLIGFHGWTGKDGECVGLLLDKMMWWNLFGGRDRSGKSVHHDNA